jgi:hypothetical protein
LPNATAEATPIFSRIVGKAPPAEMEISSEEHTRRGDATEELFRELVRRAVLSRLAPLARGVAARGQLS